MLLTNFDCLYLRFIVKCESVYLSTIKNKNSSETVNLSLVRGALAPLSWQMVLLTSGELVCVSTSFTTHNDSGRMNRWLYTQPSILNTGVTSVRTNSTSSTAVSITPHVGRLCIYCSDCIYHNVLVQLSMWLAVPLLKQLTIAYGGMDANTERGNGQVRILCENAFCSSNHERKQCIY